MVQLLRQQQERQQSGRQQRAIVSVKVGVNSGQVVGGIIVWMRAHQGVLHAALQHDDVRPDKWTPFKVLARANTERAIPLLLPAMGKGRRAAKSRAIAFGFQVVLGTLVNAILNDPGPLSLHDKELKERLSGCLLLLLEAKMNGKT